MKSFITKTLLIGTLAITLAMPAFAAVSKKHNAVSKKPRLTTIAKVVKGKAVGERIAKVVKGKAVGERIA